MPVSIPKEDEHLKGQTNLSKISDEDFRSCYTPKKFTTKERIIQGFLFFVSFGWLRLILFIIMGVVYLLFMTPCHAFCDCKRFTKKFMPYYIFVSQMFTRFLCLSLGIVWIGTEGEPDPNAKVFVYNHLTCLDGAIIYLFQPFQIIVTAGVADIPYIGQIGVSNGAIYIDRTRAHGNSRKIAECINEASDYPIAIAPEGKTTDGSVILKFRTGTFLTDKPIQPVTIRYTMLTCWGGVTLDFLVDSFLEYLWLSLSMPAAKVKVTFLKTRTTEELHDKTPEQRAEMIQLEMANMLGCKAINRSNHEIVLKEGDPVEPNKQPLIQ